jgi:hypothetical protein
MRLTTCAIAAGIASATLIGYSGTAAAGFFDVCLVPGDQTIQVNFDTTVRNEVAPLPTTGGQDNCTVEVADGVTLRLINVTIPSTDKRLIFEGGPTSQLYIQRSNIRACDSDMFGFQHMVISTSTVSDPAGDDAGCDVKEMYITGDAEITRSTLESFGSGDYDIVVQSETGNVTVLQSFLNASDDISLSTVSAAGPLRVSESRLQSAETTTVEGAGPTTVLRNRFIAGAGVSISGNPCTAKYNTPATVACAASP